MALPERRLDVRAVLAWVTLSAIVCILWYCGVVSVAMPSVLMIIGLILSDDTFIRRE